MTEKTLNLGKDLAVPRAIAARTVFIAGTKGSGKTYTGGVMAEEMLAAGVHLVILDPLGVWWGLRHDEKGGPGGYPIVILGGEHGDRPLLPTAGGIVADYVVRAGQSVILDMSGFDSNAAQDRFVTELLSKLFRLKASEKSALHLVIDEADMFAPQQPTSQTEIPLLGATKTIVTKGRSRGLSMTLITQRPQSIAKAAIEEADVVLCHRMQGVNAVKAMKAWTDLYASKEEAATFFETLPKLADGECWVWSPQFLKLFERKQIRRKRTFDSSRTPDPGEVARKPKAAAAVDLDKLTSEMEATAAEVKANDPKELRAEVARLKGELARAAKTPAAAAGPVKVREVPVVREKEIAAIERLGKQLDALVGRVAGELTELQARQAAAQARGDELVAAVRAIEATVRLANAPTAAAAGIARPGAVAPARPVQLPAARAKRAPLPDWPGRPMDNGQTHVVEPLPEGVTARGKRLLDAAATLTTLGVEVSKQTVCGWLGVHPRGGSVGEEIKALVDAGMITSDRGRLIVTPAGMAAAEQLDPAGAIENAKSGLSARQTKIFDLVVHAYPGETTREAVAEAMQIHPRGGSFGEDIARLRDRGLIESDRGVLRAREFLFARGHA